MNKIDAVFTQRSCDDGLTASEINQLLATLGLAEDEEVYPVLAEGDNAIAFGFVRNQAVSDILGDEIGSGSRFERELLAVVNDMELETPDKLYDFAGIRTYMDY